MLSFLASWPKLEVMGSVDLIFYDLRNHVSECIIFILNLHLN